MAESSYEKGKAYIQKEAGMGPVPKDRKKDQNRLAGGMNVTEWPKKSKQKDHD